MTFGSVPRRGPRPVLARRRRGALAPTLVVLGVLVVATVLFAQVWTEVLWFRQLGFLRVYGTEIGIQAALFVLGAGIMAAGVASSLLIAYRTRPVYAPLSGEQQSLDRYRESVEPLRRILVLVLPASLGLFAGSAAASQWQTVLLWWNRQPFGVPDPQFGLDVGFFVFTLPFLEFLTGFVTAVVVLAGLAALTTHYLYGGLRLQGEGSRTTRGARTHLAVLAAVFVLLQGAGYWLDRYSLLTQTASGARGITGASYTDVNVVIPARSILALVTVFVAVAFLSVILTADWRIPVAGAVLLVISAVLAAGVIPQLVQRFQVLPSAASLEAPYIEKGIDGTRAAYDLVDVQLEDYRAVTEAEPQQLRDDADTVPGIRLLDPEVVSDTFRQLEQQTQYYNFPDSLDVDRYDIDGQTRDTVIAVRDVDLAGVPEPQRNWVNDHTFYTHGFGVVAAYGNERNEDGAPNFFQSGIPSTGELGDYEPRVYFGETSPEYSIVGAPQGVAPFELDFPDDEEGEVRTSYAGDGGVGMGDLFTQTMFAIKFQDQNILLSDRVNSDSRIMYDRNPRERVEKVAPFLTMDGDPYPAVVDGGIRWIIDGYTTSSRYPYSRLESLDEATRDTLTGTSSVVAQQQRRINYIRNSVKAVVDAYTGDVTLYAWDEQDPILRAWSAAFPDLVRPLAEIDAELMSHLRYPADLFKVQRTLLEEYRVTDPQAFFGGQDFWAIPADPTEPGDDPPPQPPYYLSVQLPGTDAPSFSLTSTYIPTGGARNILTGFVAVDADAGGEAGTVREGYGQIRILELPSGNSVRGPGQVQNDINANTDVQAELLPVRENEAAEIINGNLLTLPLGGGLLYVQPVYVEGQGTTSFPRLQQVVVAFGDQIAISDTLDGALDDIFGGDSGANAGDAGASPVDPGDGTGSPSPSPTGSPTAPAEPPADAQGRLQAALADANQALQDSQAALAENDFAAYGEAQQRLSDAVGRALAAEAEISGGASPSPSASPTP